MIFSLLANVVFVADEKGELSSLAASALEIPPLPPSADYGSALIKMFLTMIAIIVLFFISYWFLKKLVNHRLQRGSDNHSIQIVEKRILSPKTMLYLVEVDNKKILLAESQLEIKRIETFPLSNEPEE